MNIGGMQQYISTKLVATKSGTLQRWEYGEGSKKGF